LQQQTDDLKNTPLARKRKRIYDLLGGAYNCAPFEDKDYYDLFHGLTYMCKTQFVLIKEAVQDSIEEEIYKKNYIWWKRRQRRTT
jgi:hypothetical protein